MVSTASWHFQVAGPARPGGLQLNCESVFESVAMIALDGSWLKLPEPHTGVPVGCISQRWVLLSLSACLLCSVGGPGVSGHEEFWGASLLCVYKHKELGLVFRNSLIVVGMAAFTNAPICHLWSPKTMERHRMAYAASTLPPLGQPHPHPVGESPDASVAEVA
jgi:hypothetical protein